MLADIEKYVIQGRMDSASIYSLLKHDYSDQPIYKKDLYNAVYQLVESLLCIRFNNFSSSESQETSSGIPRA